MTPVLFIAHHFPPMGGPGVFRSLNLVKYLPENGYKPIVLTIFSEDIESSLYPMDVQLLDQVPPNIEIIRIPTNEPKKLRNFLVRMKVFRFFWFVNYSFFWERSSHWPDQLYPIAKKLILERNIKIVYTSSGPFSPLLLGARLKKELGIKWVADLRDPFTDVAWVWPSKFHWLFCRIYEKAILRKTDKLIVNTPEVKKLYLKRGLLKENRIEVITNGF